MVTSFCWSCGTTNVGAGSACAVCATPTSGPAQQNDDTGRSFTFRSGLRSTTGLALGADNGTVSLLVASGEIKSVAIGKLKPLQEARAVPNAAYRLWLASAGAGSGQQVVLDRVSELLTTVAAQRGFALAALRLNDSEGIKSSRLSATEQAWLLMWLNHNAGTPHGAIECLAALPKEGYPDKLGVIAAHWRFWAHDTDHVQLARAHTEPFETPLADLLKLALDGDTGSVDRISGHAASLSLDPPSSGLMSGACAGGAGDGVGAGGWAR